jgi:hypothetical protein
MCKSNDISICFLLALSFLVASSAHSQETVVETEYQQPEQVMELTIDEQEKLDEEKKALFKVGYDSFNRKNYRESLGGFYHYMSVANAGDENYEWANFFYGVSLEKLGFSHAAVDTFTKIVTSKPNTKIVVYILSYFDNLSRNKPFDQEMLIAQALNSTDYGFVDDDLAAMVHYHQGIYDTRNGHAEWAEGHFSSIPHDSIYYASYLYQHAVEQTRKNEIDSALTLLESLLALPNVDETLVDTAHWTSARLLFERSEHQKAIEHYKAIKTPVSEQASFLLERAWNQYKLNKPQRAMGLLYAFEAPDFRRFFTPEMFILKSLIYKSLCKYESTLSTVDAFYARYQKALDAVYDRKLAADPETKTILYLILNDESIKRQWAFVRLLETETVLLQTLDDQALRNHLSAIYTLKLEQSAKRLRLNVDREYERLANLLLEYEENINLVRYESGVDQYQSASDLRYREVKPEKSASSSYKGKVVYQFQGEFWNDEFDDYKVHLSDECNNEQEWEVFFK